MLSPVFIKVFYLWAEVDQAALSVYLGILYIA